MNQKIQPSATGTEPVIKTDEFGTTNNTAGALNITTGETQTPPAPQKDEAKKTSRKVEIDSDVLEKILSDLGELKQKTEQIEQTAPQDQLRRIEALRASGKLVKSVKVRRFEGNLVLGWKVIEDRVWVADGKLNEVQTIEVYMEDGKTLKTSLLQFGRACLYEPYEVIKESRTMDGSIEFVVILADGKELVINSKYVN